MSELGRYTDVIKVGGAVLGVENDHKELVGQNDHMFEVVGGEISDSSNAVVLATSFAIGRGMLEDGLMTRPDDDVPELQRLATIGQPLLHAAWAGNIQKKTGQILLTGQELKPELENQSRVEEILRTVQVLLEHDNVPVVNENDAISHEEITFGSNDILSATLAVAMQRSGRFGQVRLFMLTDVNGVYRDHEDPRSRIPVMENPQNYMALAKGPASNFRIGGMASKLKAAGIARFASVPSYVYNPADGPRECAVEGEIGTYFPAWVAHNA
jgi:glutamate 5-kinase